jgi:hypothetical protein
VKDLTIDVVEGAAQVETSKQRQKRLREECPGAEDEEQHIQLATKLVFQDEGEVFQGEDESFCDLRVVLWAIRHILRQLPAPILPVLDSLESAVLGRFRSYSIYFLYVYVL